MGGPLFRAHSRCLVFSVAHSGDACAVTLLDRMPAHAQVDLACRRRGRRGTEDAGNANVRSAISRGCLRSAPLRPGRDRPREVAVHRLSKGAASQKDVKNRETCRSDAAPVPFPADVTSPMRRGHRGQPPSRKSVALRVSTPSGTPATSSDMVIRNRLPPISDSDLISLLSVSSFPMSRDTW